MSSAGLRVCDYDTGAGPLENVDPVPAEGCQPRPYDAPGVDFMIGGLKGQATQDISASWFGGYLFDAGACGLGVVRMSAYPYTFQRSLFWPISCHKVIPFHNSASQRGSWEPEISSKLWMAPHALTRPWNWSMYRWTMIWLKCHWQVPLTRSALRGELLRDLWACELTHDRNIQKS